ncbi:MAG TPA: aminotransferase class I/II-fold pyridoxal phosphate-dependent enzyme [Ktedonosporobacter sp.]|nr:aminotransferase class I/II-fold pyridoxal phosphate-dependent enzyme [Ktedonosporobacter sp.]
MTNDSQPNEQLQLSREEMRELGYQVVDMLIDHIEHLQDMPLANKVERATLEQRLREPLPELGGDIASVLQQVEQDVFGNTISTAHPRFFAYVPGPSNFVSVMADALISGYNAFVGSWMLAPGPAQVELVTIDWLRQICGLPATAGGLCVSGGSVANLTALATARYIKLADSIKGAVAYCSDQTHTATDRALKVLGFAPEQLRKLPADDHFCLSMPALQRAVAEDRAAGKRPFCVIANVGTTNTGAVDPLPELAAFCRAEDLWLHADAAYGGPAILCEQGRTLLQGLEQVDSLVLDPHKWLFQPFEIGCVITRDGRWLRETFSVLPAILRDVAGREEEINFRDYGIQLTRNARALKLWMSLKVFGLAAFRQAIARGFQLAEVAEDRLRESACWEVVTPAQMGIVTFRYVAELLSSTEIDALNQHILEAMQQDGFALLNSTILRGRMVLRLCTINPRTQEADIRETIRRLEQFGKRARGM